jgi:hypothetical protein
VSVVLEAVKEVVQKMNLPEASAIEYGLFQPAEGIRSGRWLRAEKTLAYYELNANVRR